MTTTAAEHREAIIEFALSSAQREYQDLNETWKQLDTKAQGTTAIAGIFIAAIFAFVRNAQLQLLPFEALLLLLVLAALVAVIGSAAWTMKVEKASAPLASATIAAASRSILVEADQTTLAQRHQNLRLDTLSTFVEANDKLHGRVQTKAVRLLFSQRMLVYASIVFAVITILAVLRPVWR